MCVDGSTYKASESSGVMLSKEDLLDAFDTCGAPDELLSTWTLQEEEWRSWESCHSSRPLALLQVRNVAVHFLQRTLSISGLDQMSIFDAAMLLDLYVMKTQTSDIMKFLPATCAALTRLVMKAGPSGKRGIPCDLSSEVGSFAMWLEANGFAQAGRHATNTADIINSQEAEILETLDWRVKFPTSEAWISVFFSRFDVVTQSRYAHALTYARWCSMSAASCVMTKQALCHDLPPKRLAVGLVCLSLASVGVVAFDSIRPTCLGHEEWTQMLLEAGFACRNCERTPVGLQQTVMSAILTRATGEGIASMLEHCHAVAFAMRCVAQEIANVSRA